MKVGVVMAQSRELVLTQLSLEELMQQPILHIFDLESGARVKLFQKQFKAVFQKIAWLESLFDHTPLQTCREPIERIKIALTDSFNRLHEAWIVDSEQSHLHRNMYDYMHALVGFVNQSELIIGRINEQTSKSEKKTVELLRLTMTSADHKKRQFSLSEYFDLYANIVSHDFLNDEYWGAELLELLDSGVAISAVESQLVDMSSVPDDVVTSEIAKHLSVDDLLALKGAAKHYRGLFRSGDQRNQMIWRKQVVKLLEGDEVAVRVFEIELQNKRIKQIDFHRIAIRLQRYFNASQRMKEKDFKPGYAWMLNPSLADKIDLLNICLDYRARSVISDQVYHLSSDVIVLICQNQLVRCLMAGSESAFLALRDTIQAHANIFGEHQIANMENNIISLALFLGNVTWLRKYFDLSYVEKRALNLDYMRGRTIIPDHYDEVSVLNQRSVKYLLEGLGQLKDRYANEPKYLGYLARLLRACCKSAYIDGARQIQTHVTEVDWRAITVSDYLNDIDPTGRYIIPGRSVLFLAIAEGDTATVNDIILNYYLNDYSRLRSLIHSDGLGTSYAKTWEKMILFSALLSGYRTVIENALGLYRLSDESKNTDFLIELTAELIKKSHSVSKLLTWLNVIQDRRPSAFPDICKYFKDSIGENGFVSSLKGDRSEYQALFKLLNVNWDDAAYWGQLLKGAVMNRNDLLASYVLLHGLKTKPLLLTKVETILTDVSLRKHSATILDALDLVQSEVSHKIFCQTALKYLQHHDVKTINSLPAFFRKKESRYAIWHTLFLTGVLNADEMYQSLSAMRENAIQKNTSSETITTFSVLLVITKLCQLTATTTDVFETINSCYALSDKEMLYRLIGIIQNQNAIGFNQQQRDMLAQGVTRLIQNLDGNSDNSPLLQAIIEYAKEILPNQATSRLSP
jgi:hypothetical protein